MMAIYLKNGDDKMFQLVMRIKDNDAYPIVIFPHQKRDLKNNEILLFETNNSKEFEHRVKDITRSLVRLHGDVTAHIQAK